MEPQYGKPWIVFDRDRVVHFDQIIETARQEGSMLAGQILALRFGLMLTLEECMAIRILSHAVTSFPILLKRKPDRNIKSPVTQIYTMLNW